VSLKVFLCVLGVVESLLLVGDGLVRNELFRWMLGRPLGGLSRRLAVFSFFSSLEACIEQSLLTA